MPCFPTKLTPLYAPTTPSPPPAEGDAFHVAFKDVQAGALFCMEVQYQVRACGGGWGVGWSGKVEMEGEVEVAGHGVIRTGSLWPAPSLTLPHPPHPR